LPRKWRGSRQKTHPLKDQFHWCGALWGDEVPHCSSGRRYAELSPRGDKACAAPKPTMNRKCQSWIGAQKLYGMHRPLARNDSTSAYDQSRQHHEHLKNKNKDLSVSKIIGGGHGVNGWGRRFHGFKHWCTGTQLGNFGSQVFFSHSVFDDLIEDKDVRDLEMLRMHLHLQATVKDMPFTSNQLRADNEIESFIECLMKFSDPESRTQAAFLHYMYKGESDGPFKKCQ